MGMQVGVVTNDSEHTTKQHLEAAGVLPLFDFISGYNSGHGSKPDPGPLLAFCASQNLDPASCVMGEFVSELVCTSLLLLSLFECPLHLRT